MRSFLVALLMCSSVAAIADDQTQDVGLDGIPWAKTVITPYDGASKESREATYKVYTHLMDFAGKEPITKGAGGEYTHHRGLFIGWRETTVGDKKYDTWHMTDCYQRFVKDAGASGGTDQNAQAVEIEWCDLDGKPFIHELRQINAQRGPGAMRTFDFASMLTAIDHDITLRGDSHHAGMQVRLSNEVAQNQKDTVYILPEGAKRLDNDEVSGAWWAVCNAKIGGKPYWVMHMTPPRNPAGIKLYSIRPYARFGAFFEPDLKKREPLVVIFRIILSETEITADAATKLYDEYARTH